MRLTEIPLALNLLRCSATSEKEEERGEATKCDPARERAGAHTVRADPLLRLETLIRNERLEGMRVGLHNRWDRGNEADLDTLLRSKGPIIRLTAGATRVCYQAIRTLTSHNVDQGRVSR